MGYGRSGIARRSRSRVCRPVCEQTSLSRARKVGLLALRPHTGTDVSASPRYPDRDPKQRFRLCTRVCLPRILQAACPARSAVGTCLDAVADFGVDFGFPKSV